MRLPFLILLSLLLLTGCSQPPDKKFTKEEIKKHNSTEKRFWVTYKNDVYDITDFVYLHPGGHQMILEVGGEAVDSYWAMYPFHHKRNVQAILKKYKIGTIKN